MSTCCPNRRSNIEFVVLRLLRLQLFPKARMLPVTEPPPQQPQQPQESSVAAGEKPCEPPTGTKPQQLPLTGPQQLPPTVPNPQQLPPTGPKQLPSTGPAAEAAASSPEAAASGEAEKPQGARGHNG